MQLIYWPSYSWPIYCLRVAVRDLYDSLPGPWWCKALLVAICLAIPGPQDELLLLAVVAISRRIRARKLAR
jgi:hypothetical protein